uniref:G_PROTEIN_RECEP_F1_2 domain-containing protein n=1 Tax=Rhabditophanes sp. KR3021 TaxID=114890 RepID=A0AC35U2X3_9BILA
MFVHVFPQFLLGFGYITPILIVFGVTGNIMNLTVLMTPSLRTKSNVLLSALAISDCFFLILMFPHSLGQYDFFAMNYNFRYFYFHCRMHLIAFANFFSAAAIWLVLAICMERLIGIKYPLFVRRYGMKSSFYIIGGIIGATFIVTAYSHISYKCLIKHFCSNTQIHSMCFSAQRDKWTSKLNNTYSDLAKQYVTWNTRFNAVFVVFLPILVVLWANVLLLMTLRERQKFMERSNVKQGEMGRAQMLMEQKITITVCAIVTSFTITQGPSALALLLSDFLLANSNKITTQMTIFPQFLVVLGKSLNFGLFCLSSAGFRTKLLSISKHRFTNWKPRYENKSHETERLCKANV